MVGHQLILLGIIHTDPQGRPRLDQALRQYDPQNVTFELLNRTYFRFSREERRKLSHLIFECTHVPSYPTQRRLLEKLLGGYGYEERTATRLERSKKRRIYRIDPETEDPDEAKLGGESNRTVLPTISGERTAKQVAIANEMYRNLETIGVGGGQGEILAEYVSYTYFSNEELRLFKQYLQSHANEQRLIRFEMMDGIRTEIFETHRSRGQAQS